jgi:hypothetical protein
LSSFAKVSQVSPAGFLETNQGLAKAVHARMAGFHNPSSWAMIRIRGLFRPLLTTGSHVGCVTSLVDRCPSLLTVKALVSTKMLRFFRCGLWATHHNKVAPSPTKHLRLPMIEFCPMHTSDYRVSEVTCIRKYKMSRALWGSASPGLHPTERAPQ